MAVKRELTYSPAEIRAEAKWYAKPPEPKPVLVVRVKRRDDELLPDAGWMK